MLMCDGTHLASDTSLHELRDFADCLGLDRADERCSRRGLLNYSLPVAKIEQAYRLGAVATPTHEMARRCIRLLGGKRLVKADARRVAKQERGHDHHA